MHNQDMFAVIWRDMKYFTLALCVFLLASCGGGAEEKTSGVKRDTNSSDSVEFFRSDVVERATRVFYAMPSHLELSTMIKSTGGEFQKDLMHDPQKANTYQSTMKRALALGVYGADLSYSAVYEQQNEALKYLAATKRIGESIGIQEAFSANFIERANANLDNRDSMLAIMTEMYWESNSQLEEESREHISLLVMAGGWIEGLYLACKLTQDVTTVDITDRIAEQKFAADQLTEMFDVYSEDDYMTEESYEMFKPLLAKFGELNVEISNSSISKDESSGVHTIGGETKVELPAETLEEIKKETFALRQKLIEP